MTYLTTKEASKTVCPIARITGDKEAKATCRGGDCILWRWKTLLASDHRFMSAINREELLLAGEDGKGKDASYYHKRAVANVMKNPEGFGVTREQGYCGLGGVPT